MPVSVMTVDELEAFIEKEKNSISLVDARPRMDYRLGHLPGAVHAGWESFSREAPPTAKLIIQPILRTPGYWGTLADPEQADFAGRLSAMGLDNQRKIVVYADGRASKGREGRIAWMLLYLGARDVAMLDGGIDLWKSSRKRAGRLERGESYPEPGSFSVEPDRRRRLTTDWLRARLDSEDFPHLLDTRSKKEFEGRLFWYQPRMGRMPRASLLAFDDVFGEDGKRFISAKTYKSLLPPGFEDARNRGSYCEVGVRACTISLLHEIYTGEILPVYDGSMMEWSLDPELPVHR